MAVTVMVALLMTVPAAAQGQSAPVAAPVAASAPTTTTVPTQSAPAPLAAPVTGPRPKRHHAKGDPLEGFNRAMFGLFKALDRVLYRPVSIVYRRAVPKVVRAGIRHIFSNIGEPVVFLNDVLQLKPKRAAHTLGRFAINTTIGIGGLLDVARTRPFHLPHHDNGFGNTLGRYGVGPGPYLFLPFVGPSDFRDFVGAGADGAVLPYAVGAPFDLAEYQIPHTVLSGLDERVEADSAMRQLESGAVDPYATLRSAFLQNRAATIAVLRHGTRGASALDDPLLDPEGNGNGADVVLPAAVDPLTDPAAAAPATAPDVINPVTTPPPPVTLPPH